MTQYEAFELERSAASDALNRVVAFDGAPDAFLDELLAAQCTLTSAAAGAVLKRDREGRVRVAAAYPKMADDTTPPPWLRQAAEIAGESESLDEPHVRPVHKNEALYGQSIDEHVVLLPIRGEADEALRGIAAFHLRTRDEQRLQQAQRELDISLHLLTLYETRLTLQQREANLRSLSGAMEVLTAANEQTKFKSASMAMCNEIATRFSAERVSIGILRGQYVKLKAMSQTEHINRKMKLVQELEAAMEECLDQDTELLHPAPNEATYVHRMTNDYASHHGPAAICSLPLRHEGEVVGVLTLERPVDQPFRVDEVEVLRLACDLCAPRLMERFEQDRWVGARLATQTRRGLGALVGPRHTWAKVTALLLLGFILFITLAEGTFRVDAPFEVQTVSQRVIAAPFDGQLKEVNVEPGEDVIAGETVLATLFTEELENELGKARAEREVARQEARAARQEGKINEMQTAQARADRAQAQIDLLTHRINQATITSPIDGTVVRGDLMQDMHAPVQKGEELFRVAPLNELHAVLNVPDDRIDNFKENNQRGQLATASAPGQYITFEVESIDPVAEVVNQQNVFRVRVRLIDPPDDLRPGTTGLAKAEVGEASYAWLWTHDAIDWIRMKLWL